MFKPLSIQTKTFIFVTVVILSFSTILIKNFDNFVQQRYHYMQMKSYNHIEIFYNHLLYDYRLFYDRILRDIQESDVFMEALAANNRQRLYELTLPLWERLKQDEARSNVIHYHLPNGNSFLRMHQPDKYDDNISALRATLRHIHQHQKPLVGFEKGVYNLAYRSFAPLFYRNQYIGAIEFGARPDYILDRFKKSYNLKGMIFVKKDALDLHRDTPITKQLSIGEYALQYSNMGGQNCLAQKLQREHYLLNNLYGVNFEDKMYNLYSFDMKNFQNVTIAKIIIAEDVTAIHQTVIRHLWVMYGVIALLTLLILLIIYLGFRNMLGKLDRQNEELRRHEEELEEMVIGQIQIIRKNEAIIRQQSKMAEMGNMIGAITHQWKQPLHVISTLIADLTIKSMMQTPKPNDCKECFGQKDALVQEYLEHIGLEVQYMNQTVEDFKNFLKPSKEKVAYSITTQIQSVQRILSAVLNKNSIALAIFKEAQEDTVYGYPTEFAQVILNLINNAKDAIVANSPDNRNIDITISQKNQTIEIAVQDYAGGVAPKDMESIFMDYYTTKGEQGTGIGLSIVKEIVTNMNGEIEAKNISGGACFTIRMKKNQN